MNWKKILLILIIIGVTIVILFSVFLDLAFNGGVSGKIKSLLPEPNWNSPKITSARNLNKEQIAITFKKIESQIVFNYEGDYVSDYCSKGDHGWKRNDPFAYECFLKVTHFYSFNDNFRDKLLELDSIFFKEGFETSWRPMSYMLSEYYDDLKNSNYGRTGLVSDLPSMSYSDKNHWTNLDVDYSQKNSSESDIKSIQHNIDGSLYNNVWSQLSPTKFSEIFNRVTKENKYLLIISINREYFRN